MTGGSWWCGVLLYWLRATTKKQNKNSALHTRLGWWWWWPSAPALYPRLGVALIGIQPAPPGHDPSIIYVEARLKGIMYYTRARGEYYYFFFYDGTYRAAR